MNKLNLIGSENKFAGAKICKPWWSSNKDYRGRWYEIKYCGEMYGIVIDSKTNKEKHIVIYGDWCLYERN
jgi:hypothetical protein